MFKKILVVDDIDLNNIATEQALKQLCIPVIEYAKYCDEAFLKCKKAQSEQSPYELLITDLSFKTDHRNEKITSGEQLIAEIKKSFPKLKIIAFSFNDRPHMVKKLLQEQEIDGYVLKHRNTAQELLAAVNKVWETKEQYISPTLESILQDKNTTEIDDYDIQLLFQLSLGVTQEQMSDKFKQLGIEPTSKSSIEKRISKLKDCFQANNPTHLVAIAKDMGLV